MTNAKSRRWPERINCAPPRPSTPMPRLAQWPAAFTPNRLRCCGGRVDLLTLIDKINSAVGSNVEPELLPARPGDIRDSFADISKAQERLGYTAGVSLDEGLRRTVEWFGGPSPA
jgi:nucleoside-diphosphate-sugar epimerase